MPKSKLGLNIRKLRQVYEPDIQNPSENSNIKVVKLKSIICHMLFTLAVINITLIIATIIEHKRKLNTFWKIWSYVLKTVDNLILQKNTVLLLWTKQTPGERAFIIITFLNVIIYLAWVVKKWKFTMSKYFIINTDESSSIWSLLFSAFSHTSIWSLITNVGYLYPLCKSGFIRTWPLSTFSPFMGLEEFFVMYISACLFCSLSRIYIETKLNKSENKHGSSGAVSAIFGYVSWAFPKRQLNIHIKTKIFTFISIFNINIKILQAVLCLLFLFVAIVFIRKNMSWIDTINIIAGYVFGMFWYGMGSEIIWQNRKYFLMEILD